MGFVLSVYPARNRIQLVAERVRLPDSLQCTELRSLLCVVCTSYTLIWLLAGNRRVALEFLENVECGVFYSFI